MCVVNTDINTIPYKYYLLPPTHTDTTDNMYKHFHPRIPFTKIPSIIFTNCELQGFYNLGVATYINAHYDISKYTMMGSGSGSWNAVLATYNGDKTRYVLRVENIVRRLNNEFHSYTRQPKPMWLLQKGKNYIMQEFRYDFNKFDLSRLAIGVHKFDTELLLIQGKIVTQFHTNKECDVNDANDADYADYANYADYSNYAFNANTKVATKVVDVDTNAGVNNISKHKLENALDYCIASCYTPLFTEYKLFYSYQGQYLFEGGCIDDYITNVNLRYNQVLKINPNMWKTGHPMPISMVYGFNTTWPHKKEYDFVKTFQMGYYDTAKNRTTLNKLLQPLPEQKLP